MINIHGQCLCEAVKFTFVSDALWAYQCHCSLCRKVTGSAYSTTLFAHEKGLEWKQGHEKVTDYSKGNGYRLGFCSCCGSPVPNKFRDLPLYSVPLGCLDDVADINVVAQLYMGSKAAWEKGKLDGQQFAEIPALDEMFEMLHVQSISR